MLLRTLIVAASALALAGCAGLHWERGFYEGLRSSSNACRLTQNPAAAPCAVLPAYGDYEAGRASARGAVVDEHHPASAAP